VRDLREHRWALYAPAMLVAAGLGFFKQGVFASLLGPLEFGYYSVAALVAAYGVYACSLGINEGLLREQALLHGRGDWAAARELRNVAAGALLVVGVVATAFYTVIVLVAVPSSSLRTALLVAPTLTAATVSLNQAMVELRASGRVREFALTLVGRNGGIVLVGSLLGTAAGFAGATVGEALVGFAALVIVVRRWLPGFRYAIEGLGSARGLVAIGLPFMVNNVARSAAVTMDRWFVGAFLGVAVLGQWSFAMLILALGLVVANVVGIALQPRIIRAFARDGEMQVAWMTATTASRRIGLGFVVAALPVVLAHELVVARYFPEYELPEAVAPLIYVGTMFEVMNVYDAVGMARGVSTPFTRTYLLTGAMSGAGYLVAGMTSPDLVTFALVFAAGRGITLVGAFVASRRLAAVDRLSPAFRGGEAGG
jgi:O-antigen/teichoic acid export membrane protein